MRSHSLNNRRSSSLRFESLESRRLLAGDMTNPNNPYDVNNDDHITATDALTIINYIGRTQIAGAGEAAFATNSRGHQIYPDVGGNGSVEASDALKVINALAEGQQVAAPAPNLAVDSASVTGTTGTVVIANTGDQATAVNTNVQVEVLNVPGGPLDLGTFPVGTIPAGATASVTTSLAALLGSGVPSGTYDVRFTVDTDDTVDETDESDNSDVISLALQGDDPEFTIHIKQGSNPRVHFDGDNNLIRVTSPASGKLRIQVGTQYDETIGIGHDLHIDASGQNNHWLFDDATIPDDLFVNFGGSDNVICLDGTHVNDDFIFTGSSGADTVVIHGGSKVKSSVIIKTRGGDDSVLIHDASIWRDLIYYAGSDDDMFATRDSSFGDDLIVRLEDGGDQASLQDINVKDVADLDGGGHADTLADSGINARRFRYRRFEDDGSLKDVQALIDAACAQYVNGGDDDENGTGDGTSVEITAVA